MHQKKNEKAVNLFFHRICKEKEVKCRVMNWHSVAYIVKVFRELEHRESFSVKQLLKSIIAHYFSAI